MSAKQKFDPTSPELGKRIRARVAEMEKFIAYEEGLHIRRMDWFREEIERAYASCPHTTVFRQETIFDTKKPPALCAICGRVMPEGPPVQSPEPSLD